MLDLRFIRENPDTVRRAVELKNERDFVDRILKLDERRRELIRRGDSLKARRNDVTEEIARLKREGRDASELIKEMRGVSEEIKRIDSELKDVEAELHKLLLWIPNIPHESVPIGKDSSENVVVRTWGEVQKEYDYEVLDHLTLGAKLGIIDFERGAKIAGSGFPLYVGKGATLERALINFMLDLHIQRHGYKEIFPPFLVNEASMRGTGQIPKLQDDMYYVPEDELYLIPTAEVPVTNIYRNEILKADELPKKLVAYSACFRREAGSWGRETRGFLRVHQFNKVELVKYTTPETSYDELESLVRDAEEVLQILNIPYRVVLLCTGDLGFASAKTYDIEVWAPGEGRWLEVSSCSNFEDFQARRMNIRFRRNRKSKPEFVHTLNGSGLATSRLMVALLENYQTPEKKVIVPKALHKYTGFTIIE
jgi:seryl-tRNA synthetase